MATKQHKPTSWYLEHEEDIPNTNNSAGGKLERNERGEMTMTTERHDWNRKHGGEAGKRFPGRDTLENFETKAVQPSRGRESGVDDYIHNEGYDTADFEPSRKLSKEFTSKIASDNYVGYKSGRNAAAAKESGDYRRGREAAERATDNFEMGASRRSGENGEPSRMDYYTKENALARNVARQLVRERGEKDQGGGEGGEDRRKTLLKRMINQRLTDNGMTNDHLPTWVRDLNNKYDLGYPEPHPTRGGKNGRKQ